MSLDVCLRASVFARNITHNLGPMAAEAGLYRALWHPGLSDWTRAVDIVGPLRTGLERLLAEPERYRTFNPENGWGTYETLVDFVTAYLAACEANPDAKLDVST